MSESLGVRPLRECYGGSYSTADSMASSQGAPPRFRSSSPLWEFAALGDDQDRGRRYEINDGEEIECVAQTVEVGYSAGDQREDQGERGPAPRP